jgi:hypothetical protein
MSTYKAIVAKIDSVALIPEADKRLAQKCALR